MQSSLMQYMYYLIILSVLCIDQGDGRWRERDKEHLRHDIEQYKKISEKIEREIDGFYDEYPDTRVNGDNADGIHYKYLTSMWNRNIENMKENTDKREYNIPFNITSEITISIPSNSSTNRALQNKNKAAEESNISKSDWPKFDDILLAMGKRYDWKTDRWIKVKEKLKKSKVKFTNKDIKSKENNSIDFHEKHKFNYRIVKLNKSKSRRNVVVAVSAIR